MADPGVTTTYTINTTFAGTGTTNTYIDGGKVMFMIPHTLGNSALLTIKLTDNAAKEHNVTCSLEGDVWKKGYTVNYKITIGELAGDYYLAAENQELEHSNTAVSSTLNVHSYRNYSDYSSGTATPSTRPVNWEVVGYSADGTKFTATKPTWFTDFHGTLAGTGQEYVGGNPASAAFSVAAQEKTLSANHDNVLAANASPTSTVDLSTHYADGTDKTTDETANCYIVNRRGTYKFPLVYGNKTGNVAEADCFRDSQGQVISHQLIKDQQGIAGESVAADATEATLAKYLWESAGYTQAGFETIPATLRAVLLWQDVEGLVTEVTLASDYINFVVGKAVPGNAVIALQARKVHFEGTWAERTNVSVSDEEWETLWTWHIWMTDEVYQNDGSSDEKCYDTYYINGPTTNEKGDHIVQLKNSSDENVAKILPVNLGWVPDDMSFGKYEKRQVWVKLKQSEGTAEPVVLTIIQHARQDLVTGTGTNYQWGRPTAFPAFHTIGKSKREIYDIDGNKITSEFVMAQTTTSTNGADAIAQPMKVLQWETDKNADPSLDAKNAWFKVASSEYATAMWNASSKTVYDPCPPGFRVPPASIFAGFSKTGATVQSATGKLNMFGEALNLSNETMKNGDVNLGAYFFTKAVVDDTEANAHGRYDEVVYMPATGQWHGNKTLGTQMTDVSTHIDQANGIYWTSDYFDDDKTNACMLWITPSNTSTGTEDKPVIGFFNTEATKSSCYSSVRAIRPMMIEP